jgi:DNA invertase Pin-like site-specific DNA recombinase
MAAYTPRCTQWDRIVYTEEVARRRKTDPKCVVGYIRASTAEQKLTPEAQRKALEAWCKRRGKRLVAVYEDLGVSGGLELERRVGLLTAIDALSEHRAGTLLVSKRDRIARDVIVSGMVERLVERQGAKVASADGVGNGSGPEAQLMRTMIDAFAAYERALIRARTKAALAAKAARGERTSLHAPYGWRVGEDGVRLVKVPDEQRILSRILRLRESNLSIRAIADRLNERGLPARGKRWHPTTVARILAAHANPVA